MFLTVLATVEKATKSDCGVTCKELFSPGFSPKHFNGPICVEVAGCSQFPLCLSN